MVFNSRFTSLMFPESMSKLSSKPRRMRLREQNGNRILRNRLLQRGDTFACKNVVMNERRKRKGTWNVVNDGCKREREEIIPKRRDEMLHAPCNTRLIIMRVTTMQPTIFKISKQQRFQKILTDSVTACIAVKLFETKHLL